jgi:hypothetical protein
MWHCGRKSKAPLMNTDKGIDISHANQYGLRQTPMKNNTEPRGSYY